jgi:hypothetical protein
MISSQHTTTCIYLYIIVILSNFFDAAISYKYFLSNPSSFVANEINQEAINLFTNGSIPFIFILNIILHLLTIYVFFSWIKYADISKKDPYNKTISSTTILLSIYFFIFGISLYCITRITAAMTWYDTHTNLFYQITTSLHPIVLLLLLTACMVMITNYIHVIKSTKNQIKKQFI